MMQRGQWTGGTVPVGFMVDNRKTLSSGVPNPQYRKYVPFEPFAEIVRDYFRLFLHFSGNLRYTARYIQKHGPFYPVPYSLPEGFTTRYRLNQYGASYCPSVTGLNDMFTNSAYIGHWTIYGSVVNTDNHKPIVDTTTFMKAFNWLSKVGLDGEENPFYRRLGMTRSMDESQRPVDPPLCSGLIYSEEAGEWHLVGKDWTRQSYYRYVFRSTDQYSTPLWGRSAKRVDALIVDLLRKKLDVTFDPSVWDQALEESQEQFHQERRRISKQLDALERSMKNQIVSLDTLDDPEMIRAVQQRYADAKAESGRLEEQLVALENEQARISGIQELQKNWTVVLTAWDTLGYDQKRSVLIAFVDRIVMLPLENDSTEITIYWRDNTSDTVRERRFSPKGKTWLKEEDELLLKLFDEGAQQLDIAKEFPDRRWEKIYRRIVKYRGQSAKRFTYQPMRSIETYAQFVHRIGDAQLPTRSHWTTWTSGDDRKLLELTERGANRLKIASHFPYRTWRTIQERIRLIAGKGVKVRGKGTLGVNETYAEYQARRNPKKTQASADESNSDEPSPSTCPNRTLSVERFWRATSSSTTAKGRAFALRRTSTTRMTKRAPPSPPSVRSLRMAVGSPIARTARL